MQPSLHQLESGFLKSQKLSPLLWCRYIDDFFLSGLVVKENFYHFSMLLINTALKLSLPMNLIKNIPVLDLNVKLSDFHWSVYQINWQASVFSLHFFTPRTYEEICHICSEEKYFHKQIETSKVKFSGQLKKVFR